MAKKLILITAALFGVALLGLIFMLMNKDLSDTSNLYQVPKLDPTLVEDGSPELKDVNAGDVSFRTSEGVVFHVPGKREFGYEKRVSNPDGMFQILNPWVKLYSDNNIIRITAQRGLVPLERDGQTLSSAGPDRGILEGDVSIEVFRKPENIPYDQFDYDLKYKELAVKLGRTQFEREFSRISGTGQVKIISQQFLATGMDLTMQYDQINKKLQLLEITKMQKLIVTVKKDNKNKKQADSENQPANDNEPVTEAAGPLDFMTYYLNLADNINVKTELESFNADNIEIMADISSGTKFANDHKVGNSKPDPDNNLIANNSIDSKHYRIITMTCDGPLIITSPQEKYHSEEGLGRIKITAKGDPVEIYRDGALALKASQVVYSQNTDNNNHDIRMVSGSKYEKLYLAQGLQQTISASNEIKYDFKTGLATLAGPGVINSAINDTDNSVIEFNDKISVQFTTPDTESENISVPLNGKTQIKWIECDGKVTAHLNDGNFSADKARINFDLSANADDSNAKATIENMVMSGNVTMTQEESKFTCGKLILRFRNNNGFSEPLSLWASNNIKAENDTYLIEASDRILVNFGKKRAGLAKPVNDSNSSQTAFSDMSNIFESLNPIYVIAEGKSNGVTFKNKIESYYVNGSSIEGKLPDLKPDPTINDPALAVSLRSNSLSADGIWTIKGIPAVVQISHSRTVFGDNIVLDQGNGFCSVPGAGSLNLVAAGGNDNASMPVNIKWQDGVIYNISNNILALKNTTFEIDRLAENNILISSRLYANNVDIELDEINNSLKNFRAYGDDLRLISNKVELSNNDLLSQSQLSATQLLFENYPLPKLTASGGGWLEHIVLCSPDNVSGKDSDLPAELQTAKQQTNQTDKGYYFLEFTESMTIDIDSQDISFASPIAIHHLPLTNSASPEVIVNDDNSLPPGGVRLFCDGLEIANSAKSKLNAAANFSNENSPLASSIGAGDLGYVYAHGDIFVELKDTEGLDHFFSADKLIYDNQRSIFRIAGDDYNPARYDQLQFEFLNYNILNSSYNGKTWGQSSISAR